jgi:hypothetical protein
MRIESDILRRSARPPPSNCDRRGFPHNDASERELEPAVKRQPFKMERVAPYGVSKSTRSFEALNLMKIAQISPLMESCPPQLYGGTERVVSYLTEELVRRGHDVTLFASGDSVTSARLEACSERALRLDPRVNDPIPDHLIMLDRVRRMADKFDILHFHVDVLHYPLAIGFAARTVTTMHGRLDLPELRKVHKGL